jgi:hypothetical protein
MFKYVIITQTIFQLIERAIRLELFKFLNWQALYKIGIEKIDQIEKKKL